MTLTQLASCGRPFLTCDFQVYICAYLADANTVVDVECFLAQGPYGSLQSSKVPYHEASVTDAEAWARQYLASRVVKELGR